MSFGSKNYDLYYELIRGMEVKRYDIGTYNTAQKALYEFMKAYQKTREKHWEFSLPPLHYLVDAAPIVYDLKGIRDLQKTISIVNMDITDGYKEQINNLHIYAENLKQYYDSLPMNIQLRQVDMVKDCPLKHINIQNVFYIWHCFGFLEKAKINNRVYWTKISKNNILPVHPLIEQSNKNQSTVASGCLLPCFTILIIITLLI